MSMGKRTRCGYIDKYVICPYYKRVDPDRNQIVCEGVDGASSTRLGFENKQERENYMRTRCTSDYCLCAVCRGVHEFYEG